MTLSLDAIPGATSAYDIILVVVVFSIFLLPPFRAYFENTKRKVAMMNYLKAAQGTIGLFTDGENFGDLEKRDEDGVEVL